MSEEKKLRAPMTPPQCDLTGLSFMPLHLKALFDSDLYALSTGEEFKAALSLWGKAWHEKPAGSLPNDERILAKRAGVSLEAWRTIAPMALHGWSECADGRLYHKVVAGEALKAWLERIAHQKRGAAGGKAKAGASFDPSYYETLKTQAEAHLRALVADDDACLKHDGALAQLDDAQAELVEKSTKKKLEGQGQRRDSSKEEEILFLGEGWALDADAVQDGLDAGLTRDGIDALAAQHAAWWKAHQPRARKTRAQWAELWREQVRRAATARPETGRGAAPAPHTPREAPPLPVEGPPWWIDAAARLAAARPKDWLNVWSLCVPLDERGFVTAPYIAAREINNGQAGGEAQRLLGFEIRARDPSDGAAPPERRARAAAAPPPRPRSNTRAPISSEAKAALRALKGEAPNPVGEQQAAINAAIGGEP